MSQILIIEDEKRIRDIIREYFEDKHYTVLEAENGRYALNIMKEHTIDLVILDIMMPELDGFKTCKLIRKDSEVPIIILTARSDEDDKLYGFELGADE
jgi:DNA-binding response OmpR family regulator